MHRYLVALVVLAVSAFVARANDSVEKRAEQELAKLNGTWQVVSIEHESVKAPASQTDGNTWTFAKGKLVTRTEEAGKILDKVEWKVQFKAAEKRKSLAIDGPRELLAIFLLDGDDLIVCAGKELPNDFTTGVDGSGRIMWVLKRTK